METSGVFYFDPDDTIYKDHFPGRPIVPGSLIVHAFLKAALRDIETGGVGTEKKTCQVENFKFKRFVVPGIYPYSLHWEEDVTDSLEQIIPVKCCLYDKQIRVAQGTLLF